jgi:formiminotetrahydrofolate cyclodeaminase
MTDNEREVAVLELRSLIAEKEFVNIRANLDVIRYDNWNCDYSEWINDLDKRIAALLDAIKKEA